MKATTGMEDVSAKTKINTLDFEVKLGVLHPVQQPGSFWDRSKAQALVGLKPPEVTAYD